MASASAFRSSPTLFTTPAATNDTTKAANPRSLPALPVIRRDLVHGMPPPEKPLMHSRPPRAMTKIETRFMRLCHQGVCSVSTFSRLRRTTRPVVVQVELDGHLMRAHRMRR